MDNLSIIIPFYNEEKTLARVLKNVLKQDILEVIAVDDGSKDRSLKILEDFLSSDPNLRLRVEIVRHKTNLGKGAAILSGLKKSKGQYVLVQDADLEYDPGDYKKLLEPIIKGDAQFVIGNRWQAKKRGYLLAQAGNLYMNILTNFLFGSSFKDSYSCYKLGPTKIWRALRLKCQGFEIEAEITGKLANKGYKTCEVPISYKPRSFSDGKKINWKDVYKGTVTLLWIRFKDGIYKS